MFIRHVFDFLSQHDKLTKSQKRELIDFLEPAFKRCGFLKVTKHFNGERKSTMCARFEKINNHDQCEWIEISFRKYGERQFQVHFGVTSIESPYEHVRISSLVRKKSQFYYFWGPRFWTPFPNRAWMAASDQVKGCVPQISEFLQFGTVGRNIRDRN